MIYRKKKPVNTFVFVELEMFMIYFVGPLECDLTRDLAAPFNSSFWHKSFWEANFVKFYTHFGLYGHKIFVFPF